MFNTILKKVGSILYVRSSTINILLNLIQLLALLMHQFPQLCLHIKGWFHLLIDFYELLFLQFDQMFLEEGLLVDWFQLYLFLGVSFLVLRTVMSFFVGANTFLWYRITSGILDTFP